jgi:hypothetical protein
VIVPELERPGRYGVMTETCPRCDGHGGDPDCPGGIGHRGHGYYHYGILEPGSVCACDACGGYGVIPAPDDAAGNL